MFERFTDRARRAVVLAQEEARSLHHEYIGTEHLLLGLLAEGGGVAAQALRQLGAETATVRERVMDRIGPGGATPDDHIPFTPRAKKAMELSLQEALQLGHNYIGTEHLLLGLLREPDGLASQVLTGIGVDLAAARDTVVRLLSELGPPSSPARPSSSAPGGRSRHAPALDAALRQAAALAGDDLVGTHHVLAALTTADDAAAPLILDAGGFDPLSLPVTISAWDVRGTGDEDPVDRAARATAVTHGASGVTVRLEDDTLRERIVSGISTGRIDEHQLRHALARVWAHFADSGAEPAPEQAADDDDEGQPDGSA